MALDSRLSSICDLTVPPNPPSRCRIDASRYLRKANGITPNHGDFFIAISRQTPTAISPFDGTSHIRCPFGPIFMARRRRSLHPLASLFSAVKHMSRQCHQGHNVTPTCNLTCIVRLYDCPIMSRSRAIYSSPSSPAPKNHKSATNYRQFSRLSTCRHSSTPNYKRKTATSEHHMAPDPR